MLVETAAVSVAVEEAISVEEETAAAVVVVRGLQGPAAAKLAKARPAKVRTDFMLVRNVIILQVKSD